MLTIAPPEPAVAHVYACYDTDDEIIYVGCTTNPRERTCTHRSHSPWWSEVVRIVTFPFDDLDTARQREAAAIASVRPRHNQQHMNDLYTGAWVHRARSTPPRRAPKRALDR